MIEPLLSDDAFVADLDSMPRSDARLDLWWLGQSGFIIQHGVRICIDPYLSDSLTRKYANTDKPHVRMCRRVIDPRRLNDVKVLLITHAHTDHLDAETLSAIPAAQSQVLLYPRGTEAVVKERVGQHRVQLRPMEVGEVARIDGLEITAVPASHGDAPAVGYVIRGEFTIYHSGDGVAFPAMAELLRPMKMDVAILPINGKLQNMNGVGAARLAKEIGAGSVVPCHYDMFEFNTADPREQFVPECERIAQSYRILRLGERLTLGA